MGGLSLSTVRHAVPTYEESKQVRHARRHTAPANRISGLEESSQRPAVSERAARFAGQSCRSAETVSGTPIVGLINSIRFRRRCSLLFLFIVKLFQHEESFFLYAGIRINSLAIVIVLNAIE
jgi:hypothetical protein